MIVPDSASPARHLSGHAVSPPPQRLGRTALVAGIAVGAVVTLLTVLGLGWFAVSTLSGRLRGQPPDTSEPSAALPGLLDLRTSDPGSIAPGHAPGDLSYAQVPAGDDPRIASFIAAFRLAATAPEPEAPCGQGTTLTGRLPA